MKANGFETLEDLRIQVAEWASEQFGDEQPPYYCLKGATEELGELERSDLKRLQGIDNSERYADRDDVGPQAERDAVGDIIIYTCDYMWRADLTFNNVPDVTLSIIGNQKEGALAHVGKAINDLRVMENFIDNERTDVPRNQFPVYIRLGRVVKGLRVFCEEKGYDFDTCVSEAAEEVLERQWDAEVIVE